MFNFSVLFSASVHAAAFDVAIERDASNGRVNADFSAMLSLHYGLALPAAPVAALKTINEVLALAKAPKLASGPGARAAAPVVAQALRGLGEALHSAGKVKGLPMLAVLPAWADPVAIATAKAAATAKRSAAPAKASAAPTVANATVTAPAPTVAPTVAPDTPDLSSAVAMVLAAAKGGHLSARQVSALRSALDVATATAASVPTKHKGGKATVTAPAATVTAPAATVTAPAATATAPF